MECIMNDNADVIMECMEDDNPDGFPMILNDDCILHLFKYLSVRDLGNVKEAYKYLAASVDTVFLRRTRGALSYGYKDKADEPLYMITNYGHLVKKLQFIDVNFSQMEWSSILTAMNENCGENLKEFALCGDAGSINENEIMRISNTLKNIEKLELKNNYDTIIDLILSFCENVKDITMNSTTNILKHRNMFRKNLNLLKLKLCGPMVCDKLKMIVNNLMDSPLEELALRFWWIRGSDRDVSPILRLKHLKRVSIDCSCVDIITLRDFDQLISLNSLSLSNVRLDATSIETLRQMTRLKVLKLGCDCPQKSTTTVNTHYDVVKVLCAKRNFEHLLLLCCKEVIQRKQYLELIRERIESGAEKCLHLTLRHEIYIASLKAIPDAVLNANKGRIKLIDEWDNSYEYNGRDDYWSIV